MGYASFLLHKFLYSAGKKDLINFEKTCIIENNFVILLQNKSNTPFYESRRNTRQKL